LGIPLIPIEGKHKPRTIMPRIPCLYEVNILTELYSVPKYNEILPSIFMFSTVPILFGMMFSDMGHGLMLLSLAFFLKLGPIFYFMAFMSIYCGFIYN
jgi:vacuolar-type H+-ATPase subunit I/STV1